MCLETATRKPFPEGIMAAYLTFLFLVLFNSLNNAPSYISKTFAKGYIFFYLRIYKTIVCTFCILGFVNSLGVV